MSKRFQARGHFLAVRLMEPEEVRASGIIIPKTVQQEEPVGEVLSVGDAVTVDVRVGDTVVLIPYAGTQIKVRAVPQDDGQPILIIPQADIQGFIFDDEEPEQAKRAKASWLIPRDKVPA